MKAQHEQVEVDRSQTLTEFIKEDRVNLTHGVHYDITWPSKLIQHNPPPSCLNNN
jgi:hypothetical protein